MKLYFKINDLADFFLIDDAIARIVDWSRDNCLPLNIEKCHLISFTHGTVKVFSMSDLGFVNDSKLTFDNYIDLCHHL